MDAEKKKIKHFTPSLSSKTSTIPARSSTWDGSRENSNCLDSSAKVFSSVMKVNESRLSSKSQKGPIENYFSPSKQDSLVISDKICEFETELKDSNEETILQTAIKSRLHTGRFYQ